MSRFNADAFFGSIKSARELQPEDRPANTNKFDGDGFLASVELAERIDEFEAQVSRSEGRKMTDLPLVVDGPPADFA